MHLRRRESAAALRRCLVAAVALFALASAARPAPAAAAPDWGCTATPLTASLLGISLDLAALRSNPGGTPCVDQERDILDIDLTGLLGLDADVLDSSTTATAVVVPDREVTADARASGLTLSPAGFLNLLTVGVAEASVSARCPADGVLPEFTAASSFDDVRVLGLPVDLLDDPVVVNVGLVTVRIVPGYEERTATSLRRVALRVEASALLVGTILRADVAEASVSAVDNPCGAPTAGNPPAVAVAPGPGNRAVSATVTPASGAAHDDVVACTIEARPQGGSTFVPVTTTFDAGAWSVTGAVNATSRPASAASRSMRSRQSVWISPERYTVQVIARS